jgi:DNA end-binding protein Ku
MLAVRMALRSMASASVTFGMVTVPVRVYAASEDAEHISFHLLHRKCGTRVRQRYYCPTDEEPLERSDMVKGYEVAKDQYLTFTDEELQALAEASVPAIDVDEFVPLAKVDPVYLERAYYLGPDKGGERPYALLAAALRRTDRCALARWAARGKQHLVLIRAGAGQGLVMQVLHYAPEVRSVDEIPMGDPVPVKAGELKLAEQLIRKASSEHFRPERYKDEVRERTLAAIERKRQGGKIEIVPAAGRPAPITDLMVALKASLGPAAKRRRPRAA